MCLRRINTEGREPRRHGEFWEWSFAHGNKNKGIGLVGSGLIAGGCEEWLVGRQTDDNKGGGQSGGKGT